MTSAIAAHQMPVAVSIRWEFVWLCTSIAFMIRADNYTQCNTVRHEHCAEVLNKDKTLYNTEQLPSHS